MLTICFFSTYGTHPYLHSFPTRRSSDLNPRSYYTTQTGLLFLYNQYTRNNLYIYPEHRDHDPGHNGRGVVRSEEHTSELQSQSNLVCRLLLEKKNKKHVKKKLQINLKHV